MLSFSFTEKLSALWLIHYLKDALVPPGYCMQGAILPLPYCHHLTGRGTVTPILFQGELNNLSSICCQTINVKCSCVPV